MESSEQGGNHEHIEGVYTDAGNHYARQEVVYSLRTGSPWTSFADGAYAKITEVGDCTHPGCTLAPYLSTESDAPAANNLDNLPRC